MRPHTRMSVDPGRGLPDESPSPLAARLSRLAGVIGLLTVGVGVLVLLSWLLDAEHRLPMQPFTAFCFGLVGLALWLHARGAAIPYRWRIVAACATVVVSIAGLMLLEHLAGVDLGIDRLLFGDELADSPLVHPGRMSLATSLCMACFGLALLLLDAELPGGHRPAEYLVLLVMLVGLLGLEGNLFDPA